MLPYVLSDYGTSTDKWGKTETKILGFCSLVNQSHAKSDLRKSCLNWLCRQLFAILLHPTRMLKVLFMVLKLLFVLFYSRMIQDEKTALAILLSTNPKGQYQQCLIRLPTSRSTVSYSVSITSEVKWSACGVKSYSTLLLRPCSRIGLSIVLSCLLHRGSLFTSKIIFIFILTTCAFVIKG